MKSKKGKDFSYRDLQKVYTIILYEKSTSEFKAYSEVFVHHASTVCDSGLELNFLQEFYLIALDVFVISEYAKVKKPNDRLNGWLSFFCTENPEELIGMFSEMLHELDRNTTRYMVDDMREKIEKQGKTITEQQETITELQKLVAEQKAEINRLLENHNHA